MERTLLKSKIHRATVTDADLHYQGSVSIDPVLMEAANVLEWERVEIYNVTNGNRMATYALRGKPGEICINGAAAHLNRPGDIVILATYASFEEEAAHQHRPFLVFVDERNRILSEAPTPAYATQE
jgi:aspartate 1-decarboxylase